MKEEKLRLYFLLRMYRLSNEDLDAAEYCLKSERSFAHPLTAIKGATLNGKVRVFRDAFMAACQDARLYFSKEEDLQIAKKVCLEIFPNWEDGSASWGERVFWKDAS